MKSAGDRTTSYPPPSTLVPNLRMRTAKGVSCGLGLMPCNTPKNADFLISGFVVFEDQLQRLAEDAALAVLAVLPGLAGDASVFHKRVADSEETGQGAEDALGRQFPLFKPRLFLPHRAAR